jgi:hypothetical protein
LKSNHPHIHFKTLHVDLPDETPEWSFPTLAIDRFSRSEFVLTGARIDPTGFSRAIASTQFFESQSQKENYGGLGEPWPTKTPSNYLLRGEIGMMRLPCQLFGYWLSEA